MAAPAVEVAVLAAMTNHNNDHDYDDKDNVIDDEDDVNDGEEHNNDNNDDANDDNDANANSDADDEQWQC